VDVGLSHDNVDALTRQDQMTTDAQLCVAGGAAHPVGRSPGACSSDQDGWPYAELADCLQEASEGRVDAARRVAELLELLDRPKEAAVWWHRAAESGDRDAIMYVAALDAS